MTSKQDGKPETIKGEIGYYNLQDWWLSTFSQNERDHIESVYQPFGFSSSGSVNPRPLTQGDIDWTDGSIVGLLWGLSSWFNNSRDSELAKKMIKKAEEIGVTADDILDLHFAYAEKMAIYYRNKNNDPESLDVAIKAARDQIALATQAAKAFKEEYGDETLPSHAGYDQLHIILEKQGQYDEAIVLCEQAKYQGWNGRWDTIIESIKTKRDKANS